ncbi:MAG TPA: divalent-cation tolerance protein CutA [Chthoniobacterales bacterium]
MSEEFAVALSTFPDVDTARRISRELVENALVACASVIPSVESMYFWKDKVEESAEVLVIFKLTAARFAEFSKRLLQLHPYEVPEIIRLGVTEGSPDYLRWISESCSRN